jgi:hypothetical protein
MIKKWAETPERFYKKPYHQMPRLNTWPGFRELLLAISPADLEPVKLVS